MPPRKRIEFTGVRPGEKLYEELNFMEENTIPTSCEKIKIFAGNSLPSAGMESYLEQLRGICRRREVSSLVLTLKDLIPDYNPSTQLLRRVVALPNPEREQLTVLRSGLDRRRATPIGA